MGWDGWMDGWMDGLDEMGWDGMIGGRGRSTFGPQCVGRI
jgi:hypothetical protein